MTLDRRDLPEHHLYYEFSMLLETSVLLMRQDFRDNAGQTINNAVLESFLVHLRSIKDFLWEKTNKGSKEKDDITASMFCSRCSRAGKGCEDQLGGKTIREIDSSINKQISHLTGTRTNRVVGKENWKVGLITCDLVGFFKEFLQKVDKGKMEEEYLEEMKRLSSGFLRNVSPNSRRDSAAVLVSTSTAPVIQISYQQPMEDSNNR